MFAIDGNREIQDFRSARRNVQDSVQGFNVALTALPTLYKSSASARSNSFIIQKKIFKTIRTFNYSIF